MVKSISRGETLLTADQVAEFLRQNPGFFENHVDVLMNLQIPHPHGGRTVSISERQILALRDKTRQLESKLREIIEFGEENDAIGEKIHRSAFVVAISHFGIVRLAEQSGKARSLEQGVFTAMHGDHAKPQCFLTNG